MNAPVLWTSPAIHTDGNVCVDVKAHPGSVTLGQLHGEHNSYASDLNMSPYDARLIGQALIDAADKALRS